MTYAVFFILLAFVATAVLIYRAGPGIANRRVSCPEKKMGARVAFIRAEGEFGSLRVVDVHSCSLLSGAVNCAKGCIH